MTIKKDKLPPEGEYRMIRMTVKMPPITYKKVRWIMDNEFGLHNENSLLLMALQLLIQKHFPKEDK